MLYKNGFGCDIKMKKKTILTVGIMVLFVGMAVIPTVNAEEKSVKRTEGLVFDYKIAFIWGLAKDLDKSGIGLSGLGQKLFIKPLGEEQFAIGSDVENRFGKSEYFGAMIFIRNPLVTLPDDNDGYICGLGIGVTAEK